MYSNILYDVLIKCLITALEPRAAVLSTDGHFLAALCPPTRARTHTLVRLYHFHAQRHLSRQRPPFLGNTLVLAVDPELVLTNILWSIFPIATRPFAHTTL